MIGRKKEIDIIEQCVYSGKPEFMVVYGRRRVGKTYLIKEYFNNQFSFYATGLLEQKTRAQLRAFNESLLEYGDSNKTIPNDWFEAFRRLRALLEQPIVARDAVSNRRIVFLDEVPWMDTARSDFKSALDYFWNSWASAQQDILLIICGSATSWIMNNILFDKGGFYNRITRQLYLAPFSLKECEEFYKSNNVKISRQQIIDSYMVFGGIPYYMNLFDRRLSLVQNIDSLVIDNNGQLHYEYARLFSSLFKHSGNHVKIIEAMAGHKVGLKRTELADVSGVANGEGLTKTLDELEQCGFIRKYNNYITKKSGYIYQLVDPFVLFSHYVNEHDITSWEKFYKTGAYYSWRGNAFEIVGFNHIAQIKKALGISGIDSVEYSWKSKKKDGGAQIDMLIERKDDVINVCEMKYSDDIFIIDNAYRSDLIHKEEVFKYETDINKAVYITLVTVNGLRVNEYSDVIQNVITGDDLFVE